MSHLTKNGLTTTIPVTGRIPNLPSVTAWVEEIASLTRPSAIHFLDGSDEEYERLVEGLIESGTIVRLNPGKQPGSIYARTDPDDVARVEDSTFICSVDENDSGPTNNWMDPKQMKTIMTKLYNGCMVGRTMYVIPFCMGHVDSPDPKFGIEITDSAYVAISMKIMTRMGTKVMEAMEKLEADFVPALHSVGMPLPPGIWRQLPVGQEVLRAADRICDGTRRGLARRAHADPEAHLPRGEVVSPVRSFPLSLRQDEPGDAGAHPAGVEGGDTRRRHRLDALR